MDGESLGRSGLVPDLMLFGRAGDSTCGQRAVYQLGLTGIPIYNVSPHIRG